MAALKVVWLGSFGHTVTCQGRKFDINVQTVLPCAARDLGDDDGQGAYSEGHIFGVVQVVVDAVYDQFTIVPAEERDTLSYWSSLGYAKEVNINIIINMNIDINVKMNVTIIININTNINILILMLILMLILIFILILILILRGFCLPFEFSQRCTTGGTGTCCSFARRPSSRFFTDTEFGQPVRLRAALVEAPDWLPPDGPAVVLRLPLPWAILVIRQTWRAVWIPDVVIAGAGSGLHANFPKIGLTPGDLPQTVWVGGEEDGVQPWTPALAEEIADYLRFTANELHDDDIGQDQRTLMRGWIAVLQSYIDEANPIQYQHHFTSAGHGRSGRVFKVCQLINVFVLADLLRSDTNLREALIRGMKAALPSVLVPHMEALLNGEAGFRVHLPGQSTISRWRFLVDGAFMVCEQKETARRCEEGLYVRFFTNRFI